MLNLSRGRTTATREGAIAESSATSPATLGRLRKESMVAAVSFGMDGLEGGSDSNLGCGRCLFGRTTEFTISNAAALFY